MNIIDIVILAIVVVSTIFGLYRGFLSSVFNLGGGLLSFFLSFKLGPKLSDILQAKTTIASTLSGYADLSSRIDITSAEQSAQQLVQQGSNAIAEVVSRVSLPEPLARLLDSNLVNQVFGSEVPVKEYISRTIASSIMNILCYVVCFFVIWFLVGLVFRLLEAVFRLPALKQLNSIAGGALGILRGVLIVFVLLSAVPLLQTVVNMDMVNDLISQSTLAPWFTGGSMISAIANGHL